MSKKKGRRRKNTAHRQILKLQAEARRAIQALDPNPNPSPKEPRQS